MEGQVKGKDLDFIAGCWWLFERIPKLVGSEFLKRRRGSDQPIMLGFEMWKICSILPGKV
jgi:hypothetical protein